MEAIRSVEDFKKFLKDNRELVKIALQMGWADLEMLRKRYGHADIASLRKELGL